MTPKGQVTPFELLFAQSWEDPESDRLALDIQPGDTMMTITSGACNTLGFLLDDPGEIHAVDINVCQSHLLELKIAAMKKLDHGGFLEFLGVQPSEDRWKTFNVLEELLSPLARTYWIGNEDIIRAGVLFNGKYERFVGLFRKFLRRIQGGRRVDGLFEDHTIEARREYFSSQWDTRRFRSILSLFFNKHMLARRGLAADYFKFDDGSGSFYESFYRRSKHVMTELSVRDNYFLACYLLGQYHSPAAVPNYLKADHFDTIRDRLDRIRIVSDDAKHWLAGIDANSIDCFSLSNICEMMDGDDTDLTFTAVARSARSGARICFRNLMVPRTVPEHLTDRIQRNVVLSAQLLKSDRSFVYGKVDALNVRK